MSSFKVFVIFFVPLALCTIDLTVQHLQFVADHLELKDCKKLVSALHEKTFELVEPLNITDEPNKPCLSMLLTWDRTEGYGKTFNDLSLRLGQIGREDISDRLSKAIYEGEAEELDDLFISDPFKKDVPKDSFLMEDEKANKTKAEQPKEKQLTGGEILCIVLCIIVASLIVCYVIYCLFGTFIARNFRQFAPKALVIWFDMMASQVKFLCRNTKRQFMKDVVGRDRRRLPKSEIMEMNRNLNNYLNGHWPNAAIYFEEVLNSYKHV